MFFVFAYNIGASKNIKNTYELTAKFQSIEGINVGSDVMIAGIKVGSVKEFTLNAQNFTATVKIDVNADLKLPTDTGAAIVSLGILGARYIQLIPGMEEIMLQNNGEIKYTQSALNFESLIGKLIYSLGSGSK